MARKAVCSWPDTTRVTWHQDSTVAMPGTKRVEAGSEAEPGPTGCVRGDVHGRSPHVKTPSRDAALREEAKRGP